MGATYKSNVIYISKELADSVTSRERRVILAHELGHWVNKDRLKLFVAYLLFWFAPPIIKRYRVFLETQADIYAIRKTRDPDAYITLLDKLKRDDTYLSKEESIELANNLRGVI